MSTYINFMKDARDSNIHSEPIAPSQTFTVSNLGLVITTKPDGKLEVAPKQAKAFFTYRFNDWSGPEDVVALCERYVTELETLVNDGVAKKHLSGTATSSPSAVV